MSTAGVFDPTVTVYPDRLSERLVEAIGYLKPSETAYWAQVVISGWERGLTPVQAVSAHGGLDLVERAAWSHLGFLEADLSTASIDIDGFQRLPLPLAKSRGVAPIASDGGMWLAVADPGDVSGIDDLRNRFGRSVDIRVGDRAVIAAMLDAAEDRLETHRMASEASDLAERTEVTYLDEDTTSDSKVASLVDSIIERAVSNRASDIHLEPTSKGLEVRYRIDGVLRSIATHPRGIARGVVNRVKVLARMDISEQRRPQDGRFSVKVHGGGRGVDLRAVVLPAVWGEEVTLRILDSAAMDVDLDRLGLAPDVAAGFSDLIGRSNGVVLVTGPTGSGKSTTLYAALRKVGDPGTKVLSIEDPVEYRIDGVSQHQVIPKFGFADALRSFLRADPDVIFVGEIRDQETAEMAMNAAMTGHLLLSSFHARSAVTTPVRLIEMGIPAYMVSSALAGILGQRLVRKLCTYCRVREDRKIPEGLPWPGGEPPATIWAAAPGGCHRCNETGYLGRLAVGELVIVDSALSHAIAEGATSETLQRIATESGTRTLFSDGLRMVSEGSTSLDEVYRSVREV